MCGERVEVSAPPQTRVVPPSFVIGDLIGSGEAQGDDIVGETPNLAAPHGSMPWRSNSASTASKTNSAGSIHSGGTGIIHHSPRNGFGCVFSAIVSREAATGREPDFGGSASSTAQLQ
jgi:hypothetical protein